MEQNGRTHVQEDKKHHLRGQTTKGTSSSWTLSCCKKISNKDGGRPLERTPSLEEPSPTVITCFKIKIACACYNAINTL